MDTVDRLYDLDPSNDLPENFFIIMYGLRRSGKTTMLRYMLWEMQDRLQEFEIYLFSGTAEVSPEDYEYIPKKSKFPNVKEMEMDLQRLISKQKKRKKEKDETCMLLIFDDVVSESVVRHSDSLNFLAVGGRHINISVVILSQVVTGSGSVPPIIRTQADGIFVVANPRSELERKLLVEQYLTPSKLNEGHKRAEIILDSATAVQFRALVIMTTDSSARRLEDFLWLYGPVPDELDEDFRLGTEEQWENESDAEERPMKRQRRRPMIKKPSENLPDPFSKTPQLPKDRAGYIRGLSQNLAPRLGRRR
jgi:hypothetical protein